MNVGDYVRTYYLGGSIEKIIEIVPKERTDDLTERYITDISAKYMQSIKSEQVIKSSPNIIDLIEVGDYVNGTKVTMIAGTRYDDKDLHCYCDYCENKEIGKWLMIPTKDIKSIVTREQFEAMQYKVGE